jgi:CO/xanthine dehydrogenase Mo-binding subunit
LRPLDWDPVRAAPRARIDGVAKVTGEKLFARDFRARDMQGWPRQQAHALVLRAARADRPFLGIDLEVLPEELRPQRVVSAEDLARDGLALPPFYGDAMLLPAGTLAAHLGHPVALLIWREFAPYRLAKDLLRPGKGVRYGDPALAPPRDPWGAVRIVRVAAADPAVDDVHSSLQHGMLFPDGYREQRPVWPAPQRDGDARGRAMHHARALGAELDRPPRGWLVLEREYASPSTDTAAFEPDNANGWYDAERRTLHLIVASQSPHEVGEEAARMLAKARIPVARIELHPCYTVGYGSKDHHSLPFYGAVAALYGEGRPVRLANDRYEQFQSALKRHAFRMRYRIAVERKSGTFQALQGDLEGNGGGRANFSPSVALVAATSAQSIYYFPRSDLQSRASASRALDAGSARGYGTLQSMSATEMLIDELAAELRLDPIELRLRNVLRTGMRNTQGAVAGGSLRADEVLLRARAHPLWSERELRKRSYEALHPGRRHGTGFACVQKDFGTGAEAAFAGVEIAGDGRILLRHVAVEIGTGTATAQAALCAQFFGRPADEVRTAQTSWPELPMTTSGDPWSIGQDEQDRAAASPFWTPYLVTPTSASNSAYFYGHATREAARLVFERGLWPAARTLWSRGAGGGPLAPLSVRREDARWVDGKLTAAGLPPLALADLARQAHAQGALTGAVVHTFNRWQWSEGEFEIDGARERLPIDGLALRRSVQDGYRALPRSAVFYPPASRNGAGVTYYSAAGTLAEVDVELATGRVTLLAHHTILECGSQLVPELVSGQIEGGVAMGIGHALYEELPLYEDGPGDGSWNFDRYHLPRASEVALATQTHEVLAPISSSDPAKGMAEVVMIPIVGALANAVAHATGRRVRELPLTPARIREALA